jgi:hypothetical protein
MAKQTINLGSRENAGNGDALRVAFAKINSNFDELYSFDQNSQNIDGGSASTVFDDQNTNEGNN